MPDGSFTSLVAAAVVGMLIAITIARVKPVLPRGDFSLLADILAAMAGSAVLIVAVGFTVGNVADAPTMLIQEPIWKSALQVLWYRFPQLLILVGSTSGALVLLCVRTFRAKTRPDDRGQGSR